MKEKTDISERLSQMIKHLGINKNTFAKGLGYSRSQVIYDIINKKAKPSYDFFYRFLNSEFSEFFNTDWIIAGKGEMLKSSYLATGETELEYDTCKKCHEKDFYLEHYKGLADDRKHHIETQEKYIDMLDEKIKKLQSD